MDRKQDCDFHRCVEKKKLKVFTVALVKLLFLVVPNYKFLPLGSQILDTLSSLIHP